MELRERYRTALLGLAVGDALGTTLEFKPPGTFPPITDMVGGGPFGLTPGQWTDDTSMAPSGHAAGIACQGESVGRFRSPQVGKLPSAVTPAPTPRTAGVAAGSFKTKDPPAIRGTGYVVDCLEASLWAFHQSDSFKDGALLAVNLGDDADTTGAAYGQLAGAYYGVQGMPSEWLGKLAHRELILGFADQLFVLSQLS